MSKFNKGVGLAGMACLACVFGFPLGGSTEIAKTPRLTGVLVASKAVKQGDAAGSQNLRVIFVDPRLILPRAVTSFAQVENHRFKYPLTVGDQVSMDKLVEAEPVAARSMIPFWQMRVRTIPIGESNFAEVNPQPGDRVSVFMRLDVCVRDTCTYDIIVADDVEVFVVDETEGLAGLKHASLLISQNLATTLDLIKGKGTFWLSRHPLNSGRVLQ